MVHGLRYDHDCSANLLVAGMQLQDNMLEDSEAVDTLHNVLQTGDQSLKAPLMTL